MPITIDFLDLDTRLDWVSLPVDPADPTKGSARFQLQDIPYAKWQSLMMEVLSSAEQLQKALDALRQSESEQSTKVFFRDVHDHVVQIIDTIETLREMVSASLDIYLSSVSYRLNAVMRVLTVITTIFMPLSFIASIYGMNFDHMPELKSEWGYPTVLGVMAVVGVGMLVVFRKKRWL